MSKIYFLECKYQGWKKSILKSVSLISNCIFLWKKKIFFCKKMQFNIKETLYRMLFFHPWCLQYRKYIFDLKSTIKVSIIMKWRHGCKIWDWSIILHYFAEYLTFMLTLSLRFYRSSNLVLDLKMWENFVSNLPVWKSLCYGYISLETATLSIGIFGTLSSLAYFFCAITLGYFDGEITKLTSMISTIFLLYGTSSSILCFAMLAEKHAILGWWLLFTVSFVLFFVCYHIFSK